MPYALYNEDAEKMRVVSRLEEATAIVALRLGWTYKFFRQPKPEPFNFEEAPF